VPFISAAKGFLEDPGELSEDPNLDIMYDTVWYLLEGAIGFDKAKKTDKILQFLNDRGHTINGRQINRTRWKISILDKLRDEGIFIASAKNKGMYIIENRDEAETFYSQYSKSAKGCDNTRLSLLSDLIEFGCWDN
jgi:hypothetical protein